MLTEEYLRDFGEQEIEKGDESKIIKNEEEVKESLPLKQVAVNQNIDMSKRTILNDPPRGLVENVSIPAELHSPDGLPYATFGSVVPIHCCPPEKVEALSKVTHHYADIFTEQTLAPLGELAYVRIDEQTAEKVFINRVRRILVLSSDGVLAQWRAAPTFESTNQFVGGTPIVNADGSLVSVVTVKRGNHYAVSNIEGEGGYFETPHPWKVVDTPEGHLIYGDRTFSSREELRAYVHSLPPSEVAISAPPLAVVHKGPHPRLALVCANHRQLAHYYLAGVQATGIDYL